MTQNELTYILAIAESRNISRAAQELYITQPSLSEALAKVEAEMGEALFLRTSDGLVPTAFGLRYLDTARRINACYKHMLRELEDFRELRKGSLTFGIPLNLGTCLLPEILPSFLVRYPEITVRFKEANSVELYRLLLSGTIDFCIMHEENSHDSIICEFLSDDPFYLVMPQETARRHCFRPHQTLGQEQLMQIAGEPFLMIADRQKLRQVTDSILKQIRISPQVRFTTKSMETAKRLAASGMGVTFLPYSYLHLFSGTEHLAYFPLDQSIHARWNLVVAYPQHHTPSRCSLEFIRHLKQSLATTKLQEG